MPGVVGELYAIWVADSWSYASYSIASLQETGAAPLLQLFISSINTSIGFEITVRLVETAQFGLIWLKQDFAVHPCAADREDSG
jgi:hypothetical protein